MEMLFFFSYPPLRMFQTEEVTHEVHQRLDLDQLYQVLAGKPPAVTSQRFLCPISGV